MKMFDYSELIRVIDNVEIREEKERVMGILKLKERCEELETSLIESGILDDWNRLKELCARTKIRLCVSHLAEHSIGCVLGVGDFRYCNEYQDDGIFAKSMDNGGRYGFVYESDRGIVWRIQFSFSFGGFNNNEDELKYKTKIYLLETFRDTYEHYRDFQLKKIEDKFAERIKAVDIIK